MTATNHLTHTGHEKGYAIMITPGKWKVTTQEEYESFWGSLEDEPDQLRVCSFEDDGEAPWTIARIIGGLEDGQQESNARLIARAPELEAENAELLAENAHLREIEAANKETIKYWRGQYAQAQSAVNFYDGIVLGDGDHDKVMLARDGDIFMRLMKALGMDVSGSDVQEIVDRVEELRGQVAERDEQIERLREALKDTTAFVAHYSPGGCNTEESARLDTLGSTTEIVDHARAILSEGRQETK